MKFVCAVFLALALSLHAADFDLAAKATNQLGVRRALAFSTLDRADAVRDAAREARMFALANLSQLLEQFEGRLTANGES